MDEFLGERDGISVTDPFALTSNGAAELQRIIKILVRVLRSACRRLQVPRETLESKLFVRPLPCCIIKTTGGLSMDESSKSVDVNGYSNDSAEVGIKLTELEAGRYDLFIAGMQHALSSMGIRCLAVRKEKKNNGWFNFTLYRTTKEDFKA